MCFFFFLATTGSWGSVWETCLETVLVLRFHLVLLVVQKPLTAAALNMRGDKAKNSTCNINCNVQYIKCIQMYSTFSIAIWSGVVGPGSWYVHEGRIVHNLSNGASRRKQCTMWNLNSGDYKTAHHHQVIFLPPSFEHMFLVLVLIPFQNDEPQF